MINVAIAFAASTIFCLISIPILIPFLQKLKFGQHVRSDGPQGHLSKAGTPTMGGIVFYAALVLGVVLTTKPDVNLTAAMLVTFGFGLIGFLDDFIMIVMKRPLGLRAKEKIIGQLILSLLYAYVVVYIGGRGTEVYLPLFDRWINMGWLYIPFAVLVMTSANAVNLTDGLDGLAAGVTFFAALGYLIIAQVEGATQISAFCAALAGCCIGFLFYNIHPAKIFMGDTGAFILGGALCSMAVITKTEFILLILGGVFVLEALSVMIQVIYFKATGGKRIFRMAPLHHHFELSGWSEQKVVIVFWLAAAFCAVIAVLIRIN